MYISSVVVPSSPSSSLFHQIASCEVNKISYTEYDGTKAIRHNADSLVSLWLRKR